MRHAWKSFVWCLVLTVLIVPLADAAKKQAGPEEVLQKPSVIAPPETFDFEQPDLAEAKKPSPEAPARQVTLLQRKATKHGKGLGKTTGWIHRAALKMKNVNMVTESK